MARIDGQRRALAAIAARQSGGTTPAKLPKLDDNAIGNLVASFEVANERMSAVRYVADYTFHFRPDETRRALGSPGPAAAEASGKPVVVLPGLPVGRAVAAVGGSQPVARRPGSSCPPARARCASSCRWAMLAISPRSMPTRRARATPRR